MNPTAIVFVLLTTVIGYLVGHAILGLAIGLLIVLVAALPSRW